MRSTKGTDDEVLREIIEVLASLHRLFGEQAEIFESMAELLTARSRTREDGSETRTANSHAGIRRS